MISVVGLIVLALLTNESGGFTVQASGRSRPSVALRAWNPAEGLKNIFSPTAEDEETDVNPLREVGDMFSNFDAVIDDFFNKRMGNGEIFYGKRRYKPSGTVEGKYNGMGLTDRTKIDMAREYKEQVLAERKLRQEAAKKKGK